MSVSIYVIGMENGYRGDILERQLHAAGLDFERIYGVHGMYEGRPVATFADQQSAKVVYGHELSAGEIGCALAHREAYKSFSNGSDGWALVLEDDARVMDAKKLIELIDWTERATFTYPHVIACYARGVLGSNRITSTFGDSQMRDAIITPFTTTAYLVNRAAANLFVDAGLPLINPADWPMRTEGWVHYSIVFPWIVAPEDAGDSAVGSRLQEPGSASRRMLHRMAVILHLKWFAHGHRYGSYRSYWSREVVRFFLQRLAGKDWPYEIPVSSPVMPTARPSVESLARILRSTRRLECQR